MTDPFAERLGPVPWVVIGGVLLVLAVALAILPAGEGTEGARWVIERWARPVALLFLGAAALARSKATFAPIEWAAPLGATGGLLYVTCMVVRLMGGAA